VTLKMLDVCCGMGGVSDGFALEGFDVTGIDIEDAPNKLGYKHRFIQADIRTLDGKNFRGYDVIWGSTPCRNFTKLPDHGNRKDGVIFKWKVPKNPAVGLELVNTFLKFIDDAQPKYWILENVDGLKEHLDLKPRAIGSKIKGGKRHVFYGNFPSLLIPQCEALQTVYVQGKLRSWIRAKIPISCSSAFARACREALESHFLVINSSDRKGTDFTLSEKYGENKQ